MTWGDRHQWLILRLQNGRTLLAAHDIDVANRLPNGALDRTVHVHGEYEWKSEGGVIHWTHDDPQNLHVGGWSQFNGARYR